MPTPDQTRIADDRARPRIIELWWALRPLGSVVRFMQTGAHPDDETTAMLAALALRDGINVSYACSTRGEGGQNDIGTEAGAALGALRTREMERACDVLGMRMYWLSESHDDPITDFGFSKSGVETLGKWGRERTMARFVEIVRTERPDIICPTFLDIPGQHGHHRAMTEAAHAVMVAAADAAFPSNLPPWQVRKLYLPAWSGAGQAYDDDLPPPPATLTIEASGRDPVSGWSYGRIAQQSRAAHRTQGMGRWVPAGPGQDWPLHLAQCEVKGPDTSVTAGLPRTVADLADLKGAAPIASDLRNADEAICAALAAFPDFPVVAQAAIRALGHVRAAHSACPAALREEIVHRLEAKEIQLGHVIRLALGVEARGRVGSVWLRPGDSTDLETELECGDAEAATVTADLPPGWRVDGTRIELADTAPPSDPYRAAYDPAVPDAPALRIAMRAHGHDIAVRLPVEAPPVVLPATTATLSPGAALINRATDRREVAVALSDLGPTGATAALGLPDGWSADASDTGVTVHAPDAVTDGLYTLPLTLDGRPAHSARRIAYPHIAPTAHSAPAVLQVRVLNVAIPQARVGYIGGGNDRVAHWLAALGADVTELSDAEIASDAALAGYDTIVIGIFAMRFRAGLAAQAPRLHRWTEAGGTLITLYHRPWDNWDPETIPPRRLQIGQPSLRWRVTDETAAVTQLAEHPILAGPNRIGPDDWQGWVKERGLYFAKSWDPAYVPLLEMADPGEAPLRGALLVADIGRGRHVHTSLIVHLQMENLVPGAFRLMANFIARRDTGEG